jgi:hypothetical protein
MWADSAPLTAVSILMLAAFLLSLAGCVLDHRIITGVRALIKPAKFAISSAIFAGTMAWMFRYLEVWRRFVRAMGWVLAIALVIEVGLIDLQAARGITSHFNFGTAFDRVVSGIMGAIIGDLWLASVGVLIALFRQRFSDPAWGWSLRLGMLVTVLGAGSGGLMLRTTPEQAAALRLHREVAYKGGHTVGAPDGSPGLPGIGWSSSHGDLRVPHFLGLHGVQAVPFLVWLLARRRRPKSPLAFAVAASYLSFVAILLWQAFRGQSVAEPDRATWLALTAWLSATLAAVAVSVTPAGRTGENSRGLTDLN